MDRRLAGLTLALCALLLMVGMGSAAGLAPEEGGWKGKTKQGFYIYFGVGEGAVKNVRLTFREVVCGKQSVHLPESRLAIDEAGHFAGALVPNRLEFEGTFVAPDRVSGKIVSLETTGLPGCTRKVVGFSARPR
jgi:hypothetical protein